MPQNLSGYSLLTNGGTAPEPAPAAPPKTPQEIALERTKKLLDQINTGTELSDKVKNSYANAAKQLKEYLAEVDIATKSAVDQANAYLKGEDAVSKLSREQEIENQVLKLGEAARAKVTAAVNKQRDAEEKRDVDKQIYQLRKEIEQIDKQAVAILKGVDAVDRFNIEKEYQQALTGKNIDALSAEAKLLRQQIELSHQSAKSLQQVNDANDIVDRLLPMEKLNREYEREAAALEEATKLYPEKSATFSKAMQKLNEEYDKNVQEATAWGKWTTEAFDRVDAAAADAWKSMLTGAGNTFGNIKDMFLQMIAEMAHMAITRPIMVQIGTALGIGGLTNTGTGIASLFDSSGSTGSNSGSAGTLSNLSSLISTGSTGYSFLSGTGSSALTGLSNINTGTTGFGLGQTLTTGNVGSASYAGSLGYGGINGTGLSGLSLGTYGLTGALAGFQQGGVGGALLGGGATAGGAYGGALAGSAIASYFGAEAGTMIGSLAGPVGGFVGAALGGVIAKALGSLFGGSGEKYVRQVAATRGYYDSSADSYVDQGWPTGYYDNADKFGEEYDDKLSQVTNAFSTALGKLYDEFGSDQDIGTSATARLRRTSGNVIGNLYTNINGETTTYKGQYDRDTALQDMWDDAMGQWLAQAIRDSDLPSYFTDQFKDLAGDADTTAQAVSDKISTILGNFDSVNAVLTTLDKTAFDLSNTGLKASDNLIALSGGLDQLQSNFSTYYDSFYSEAEKTQDTLDGVSKAFADAGVALPDARDGFRGMVDDIDTTTEAGQSMFATLLGLAGQADAYFDIIEAQATAANQALAANSANYYDQFTSDADKANDTLAAVTAKFSAMNIVLPGARDGFIAAVNAIDTTTESGQSMFKTMMALAGQADSYYDILESRQQELATSSAAYYDAFTSDADKQSNTLALVNAQFEAAGIALPALRDGFVAAVSAIDQTTESGAALFKQYMALSPAAASYYSVLESQANTLKANQSTYYDQFTSDAQKTEDTLSSVSAQFSALNIELPGARDGFRGMVDDIDTTTESGQSMYKTLMSLAGQADSYYDILEDRSAEALTKAKAAAAEIAQAIADALNGAVDSTYAKLQRSVAAQQNQLTTAYNAQIASLNDMADTASTTISGLQSVFGNLDSALKTLLGSAGDVTGMLYDQATATLQSALALGRSGSSLDNFSGLDDALSAITGNTTDRYSSYEDFARAQGRAANVLADLKDLTGTQLTSEQQVLKALQDQIKVAKNAYDDEMTALDQQLDLAQAQLDALHGVDNSITSVESAIQAMNAAIVAALGTLADGMAAANTPANNASIVDALYQAVLGREADAPGAAYWQQQLQSGAVDYDQVATAVANGAQGSDITAATDYLTSAVEAAYQQVLGRTGDAAGVAYYVSQLQAGAIAGDQLAKVLASGALGTDQTAAANYLGIPGFASGGLHSGGLRLVGENGPELEVTGPSRIYNNNDTLAMLSGGSASVDEIRALRTEVSQLRAYLYQITKNTKRAADGIGQQNEIGLPAWEDA